MAEVLQARSAVPSSQQNGHAIGPAPGLPTALEAQHKARLRDKIGPKRVFQHVLSLRTRDVTPSPSRREKRDAVIARAELPQEPASVSTLKTVLSPVEQAHAELEALPAQAAQHAAAVAEPSATLEGSTLVTLTGSPSASAYLRNIPYERTGEICEDPTPQLLEDSAPQVLFLISPEETERQRMLFRREVAPWLGVLVKAKLESYREGEAVCYISQVRRQPLQNEPSLIRISIGGKASRHAEQVQAYLRQSLFRPRLHGFEIEVRKDPHVQYLAATSIANNAIAARHPEVYVSVEGDATSYCGAMLCASAPRENYAQWQSMWTCGGLVSVSDRMYALSVAHPLLQQMHSNTSVTYLPKETTEVENRSPLSGPPVQSLETPFDPLASDPSDHEESPEWWEAARWEAATRLGTAGDRGQSSKSQGKKAVLPRESADDMIKTTRGLNHRVPSENTAQLNDEFLARQWKRMGNVAHVALSGSTAADDSDWMLIQVDHMPLLPNILKMDGGTREQLTYASRSSDASEGKRGGSCTLHTSHGLLRGTVAQTETYLTFGRANFWVTTIAVDQALQPGDSGTWVVQENEFLGAVIAGSRGEGDDYTAMIVEASNIFASIAECCEEVLVRLPTPVENDILETMQMPGNFPDQEIRLATLYMQDIIDSWDRPQKNAPAFQIEEMAGSSNIDIGHFLTLGQFFPLSSTVRSAVRRCSALSLPTKYLYMWPWSPHVQHSASLWPKLLAFQAGENFIGMLAILIFLHYSDLQVLEFAQKLTMRTALPDSGRPSDGIILQLLQFVKASRIADRFKSRNTELSEELSRLARKPVEVAQTVEVLAALREADVSQAFLVHKGPLAATFAVLISNLLDTKCIWWANTDDLHEKLFNLSINLTHETIPRAFFGETLEPEEQGHKATRVVHYKAMNDYLGLRRAPPAVAYLKQGSKRQGAPFSNLRLRRSTVKMAQAADEKSA